MSDQNAQGYRHCWLDGSDVGLPLGKVVCVGRNYAEHARELGNEVPDEPILFIKPASALASAERPIHLPQGHGLCHFETEIAVLIGKRLGKADPATASAAATGIGIGIDLTLRELQSRLKEKGQPWERAKAFDGACPLSRFWRCDGLPTDELALRMEINGELRQQGSSAQMLFPLAELIAHMSSWFSLMPGDVVLTGTPAGVGALQAGDRIHAEISDLVTLDTEVATA